MNENKVWTDSQDYGVDEILYPPKKQHYFVKTLKSQTKLSLFSGFLPNYSNRSANPAAVSAGHPFSRQNPAKALRTAFLRSRAWVGVKRPSSTRFSILAKSSRALLNIAAKRGGNGTKPKRRQASLAESGCNFESCNTLVAPSSGKTNFAETSSTEISRAENTLPARFVHTSAAMAAEQENANA